MNAVMIGHLVAKDCSFHKAPVVGAGVAALLALAMLRWAGAPFVFYLGAVLLITVVISIGIYVAIVTVIHERTRGMLPFVMSLPIGLREYTAAKLVSSGVLFLVPWAIAGAGAATVILIREDVANGLLPYAMLLLLHLLTGYVLTLAAALISGSEGWTIAVAGFTNLAFQGFMYWAGHLSDVVATIDGPAAVWPASIRWLISAELLAVGLILAITWGWQARRTDYT